MKTAEIMIVEDDAITARSIAKVLEDAGYRISGIADSGRKALRGLEKVKADLILMDIRIKGGWDGVEAAEKIRKRFDIPVVFLTAYADEATVERAKAAEPFGFVVKPFTDRELCSAVEIALYRHESERKLRTVYEALHESEERLKAIIDSAQDCIFVKDLSSTYILVNRAMGELFKMAPAEMVGSSDERIFPKVVAKKIRKDDLRVFKGEVVISTGARPVEGSDRTFHVIKVPIRDSSGKICGLCGIARDITESRKADLALRESEQRYRLLADSITDVVFVHDKEGRILSVSPSIEDATGWTVDKVVGTSIFDMMHPDEVSEKRLLLQKLIKSSQPGVFVNQILRKDGSYQWMETVVDLIADDKGKSERLLCTSRDITTRKEAEEALRISDRKLSSILAAAPSAIGLVRSRVLEWANDRMFEMTGYSREELIGKNVRTVYPSDEEYERVGKFKYDQIRRTGVGEIETQFKRKDDSIIEILLRSAAMNPKDLSEGVSFTAYDISDRKRARSALELSESRYRRLFSTVSDAIMVYDLDAGEIIDANDAAERLYGCPREEFLGRSHYDFTAEPEKTDQTVAAIPDGGFSRIPLRYHKRKDGTIFPAEISLSRFTLDGRDLVIAVARDITARLQAEEALRASEQRYRTTVDAMDDYVHVVDRNLKIVLYNDATLRAAQIAGFAGDPIGKDPFELCPFVPLSTREEYNRVLKTCEMLTTQEENFVNGDTVWTETRKIPIVDDSGDATHIVTIIHDITEHKAAERALRESEEKYRLLFENTGLGVGYWSVDGKLLSVNRTALEQLGGKVDDWQNKTAEEIFGGEMGRLIKERISRAAVERSSIVREDSVPLQSKARCFDSVYVPVVDSEGNVKGVQITSREITEQKKVADALKASEEKYRTLAEKSIQGILIIRQGIRISYANAAFARITGYSVDELMSLTSQQIPALLHAEDRELVLGRLKKRLAGENPTPHYEFRMVTKQGAVKWVEMNSSGITLENEGAVLVTIVDVTERKLAVQELLESEAFNRTVIEHSPLGVSVRGRSGKLLVCNRAWQRLNDLSDDQVAARLKKVTDHLQFDESDDYLGDWQSLVRRIYEEGGYLHVPEVKLRTSKEGEEFWVSQHFYAITNADGEVERVVILTEDISERKRGEEALRNSERLLRESQQIAMVGSYSRDLKTGETTVSNNQFRLFGYSPNEVEFNYDFVLSHIHAEDLKRFQEANSALEKHGTPFDVIYRIKRKDGVVRTMRSRSSVERDSAGTPMRQIGALQDITDRVEVEERLRMTQERFKDLVEHLGSGVAVYESADDGEDFIFRDLNRAGEKMDGVSRRDLVGRKVTEAFPSVAEMGLLDVFRRVWRTGVPEFQPAVLYEDKRLSGWRQNYVYKLSTNEIVSIYDDVTERKTAEQALIESEQRYRTLQENLPLGVFRSTPAGRFLSVNAAAIRILGFESEEELLNTPLGDLYCDPMRRTEVVNRTIADGHSSGNLIQMRRRDGRVIWVSASARAVRENTGEVVYFDGVLEDITERRLVEEALRESETRYRDLVESSGIAIAVDNQAGNITYFNERFSEMFGYEPDEIKNKSFASLVHPEDRGRAMDLHSQRIRGERDVERYEFRGLRKDGSLLSLEVDVTPLKRGDVVLGTRGFIRDISERKRFEEQLRYHAELLENVSDAIISTDLDFNVKTWNRAAESIYGLKAGEVIGKTIHPELIHKIGDGDAAAARRLLLNKGRWLGEVEQRRSDGSQLTVLSSVSLVTDQLGNATGMVAVNRDVTQMKQVEQELRHLNEELERRVARRTAELSASNRELEAFAYSVSHDLRAPLRAIDGFSRMLDADYTDKLDSEGRRVLKVIRSGAQDMGKLIDNLLTFSRLGRQALHETEVDMTSLVKDIVEELKSATPDRNVKVKLSKLPGIVADPTLIRVVLGNLLSNAFKYTRERERAMIEVAAETAGEETIFSVKDNGVGFDMRYVDKLFNVFQRLHSIDEFEGTGVGLAIVQRIVHRHGGRVWAEGTPDKGAAFFFALRR